MRFLTRLHALAAMTVIAIVYFSLARPSLHIQALQKVWQGSARRVVVFGDDWSDTGTYRVSPPPKSTLRHRDPDRGEMWTETLCKELVCDVIDNFARSEPANVEYDTIGSVVDSDIFANATSGNRDNETLALFDFEAQVQQFINFEKRKPLMPGRARGREWTIFTVFFGIWDILEYSSLEKAAAMHAIDRSVEELLHNLDVLAAAVNGPIKVVVPKLIDVTFLPRFQSKFPTDELAQTQHQSIFLWTYWNTALSQAAVSWGGGDLYVPDLNEIVMSQVREKQMYSKQVTDAKGNGKQEPLFDEVEHPCIPLNADGRKLQAAEVDKCTEPARHLFWDGMHLNGPAHELIGREAARLVQSNSTVNTDARERASQGAATDQKDGTPGAPGFALKFPPGY